MTGTVVHEIPPVWNTESRILMLGTMPSPKSRERGFFYMHPQNRFWRVLSAVFGETLSTPNNHSDTEKAIQERKDFLLRHNIASVIYVMSGHSAFSWFKHLSTPGRIQEYIPECRISSIVFDSELELFPDFLMESVPAFAAPDHAPVAILIDDPYLSDYLSGEIRVGSYSPPSWGSFFGTAFHERSMVFPYLDLKLDELAAALLRTASAKAENPVADLACDFHLIQFRNPGPD